MKKSFLLILFAIVLSSLSKGEQPFKPGDMATDFNLKNLRGDLVSLSGMEDAKGFIVVFSCNTCPVVKKYEQRIIDLHNEFSSKGFPVVAINSNDKDVSPGDSYEEMKKVAKNKKYPFEYLYDESQEVAKRYGAANTPHVYVLAKKDGGLKVEYVGAIDNNADDSSLADKKYVADAVKAVLDGKQVPLTSTKAIGCTIKWKNK